MVESNTNELHFIGFNGAISLLYWKGNLTETSKLRWYAVCDTNKWYHSTNNLLVNSTAEVWLFKPHKIKGFADDVTIISSTSEEHGKALATRNLQLLS